MFPLSIPQSLLHCSMESRLDCSPTLSTSLRSIVGMASAVSLRPAGSAVASASSENGVREGSEALGRRLKFDCKRTAGNSGPPWPTRSDNFRATCQYPMIQGDPGGLSWMQQVCVGSEGTTCMCVSGGTSPSAFKLPGGSLDWGVAVRYVFGGRVIDMLNVTGGKVNR